MTEHYRPPQRAASLRILTEAGWVRGTLSLPAKTRLLEFLEHANALIPLTDVKLEGKVDVFAALNLRRRSVLLILADADELSETTETQPTVEHVVECLLPYGFVSGRLSVMKSVRVSDHLALHPKMFVRLRDVRVRLRDPWSSERIDLREPVVLLNTQAIVGLAETEPLPGAIA